ncbi:hypothetical protein AGMMS49992_03090 [Clostridia bacterium]|nr:hypothetical protein AGMMS49992_03090 [Clostridia bacterium]
MNIKMNTNNSPVLGMAKINWRHSMTAYLIAAITLLLGVAEYIVSILVKQPEGNITLAAASYLYTLPLFMGILVPAQHFSKLMNLGGKRMDFFKSAILTYLPIAAAVSLVNVICRLTIDPWMLAHTDLAGFMDCLDVFGFMARGPVAAFFQMTAFLLLVSCVAHTITLVQGRWYGWVTDALIVAIISVFTPIAPLRAALVWFFRMIIFHPVGIVQWLSCMAVVAIVYGASIVPTRSKAI